MYNKYFIISTGIPFTATYDLKGWPDIFCVGMQKPMSNCNLILKMWCTYNHWVNMVRRWNNVKWKLDISSKILAILPIIESGLVPLTMIPFVRVNSYIADRVRPSKTVSMGYGITSLYDPIILVMHSLSLFVQVLYAPVYTRVCLYPRYFLRDSC